MFVDPELLGQCTGQVARQFRLVRCRSLPGHTVGYVAKFHTLLLTSFSRALLVSAEVLFARSPEEVLDSAAFEEHGAVLWPDLWGDDCRVSRVNSFGQSAWANNVMGRARVGGLEWRHVREMAQEAETGVVAVDTTRHSAALDLGVFMKDDDLFFAKLFHGDKDIFRLAFLLLGASFHFVPHLPALSMAAGAHMHDSIVHFFGDDPAPLFFNQMRSKSSAAFRHLWRLRPELRALPSVCSTLAQNHYEEVTNSSGSYSGERMALIYEELQAATDRRWSRINAV